MTVEEIDHEIDKLCEEVSKLSRERRKLLQQEHYKKHSAHTTAEEDINLICRNKTNKT